LSKVCCSFTSTKEGSNNATFKNSNINNMNLSENELNTASKAFQNIENSQAKRTEIEEYFNNLDLRFAEPIMLDGNVLAIKNGQIEIDYDGEIEFEDCSDFDNDDLIELYNAVKN